MEDVSGVCVWLTGRGGAGKSTLAAELERMLRDRGRTVTVLDRVPELEKAPGEFTSRGKLRRKAFVAARIADHGGVAICVTISSRREDRESARRLVGADRFVEVFIDAPTAVAQSRRESRNRRLPPLKRLRRTVRALVRRLGIARSVGFEVPERPAVRVDSVNQTPVAGARRIVEVLERDYGLAPLAPDHGP